MHKYLPFLLLVIGSSAFFLAGCKKETVEEPSEAAIIAGTVDNYYTQKIGTVSFQAQFAVHLDEMRKGLMYRDSMEKNSGMIFAYKQPQKLNFYMRNTRIPLDIGYISRDGTLKEIYRMFPLDETPVGSTSDQIQYALEMNQGWFAANGVKPGAKLDLSLVAEALEARGFKREEFGLPAK